MMRDSLYKQSLQGFSNNKRVFSVWWDWTVVRHSPPRGREAAPACQSLQSEWMRASHAVGSGLSLFPHSVCWPFKLRSVARKSKFQVLPLSLSAIYDALCIAALCRADVWPGFYMDLIRGSDQLCTLSKIWKKYSCSLFGIRMYLFKFCWRKA